jgi:hypothetical protein
MNMVKVTKVNVWRCGECFEWFSDEAVAEDCCAYVMGGGQFTQERV